MDADGARIDLIDPVSGLLHGAYASGSLEPQQPLPADPDETIDQGVAGQAVVSGGPFWTGDYLRDPRFRHLPVVDRFIEASGIHSVMAVPLTDEDGSIGALLVSSGRPDAWSEPDASLLDDDRRPGLDHDPDARASSPSSIARATRSPGRPMPSGRCARSPAAVSATHDQDEILQAVIDASVRLLGATGAMIDLLGDTGMAEAWSSREAGIAGVLEHVAPRATSRSPSTPASRAARCAPSGSNGPARTSTTNGSSTRPSATPSCARSASARSSPRRSSTATWSSAPSPSTAIARTPSARPTPVSCRRSPTRPPSRSRTRGSSMSSRRSRTEIARRADSEQTLREIAARVSAILEPDEVLQQIVDESTRLLQSDGARIDLWDPAIEALRWSYAAGDDHGRRPGLGEDRRPQARPGGGRHGVRRAARRSTPTTTSSTTASPVTTRRASSSRRRGSAPSSPSRCPARPARSAPCRSCRARSPPTTTPTGRC